MSGSFFLHVIEWSADGKAYCSEGGTTNTVCNKADFINNLTKTDSGINADVVVVSIENEFPAPQPGTRNASFIITSYLRHRYDSFKTFVVPVKTAVGQVNHTISVFWNTDQAKTRTVVERTLKTTTINGVTSSALGLIIKHGSHIVNLYAFYLRSDYARPTIARLRDADTMLWNLYEQLNPGGVTRLGEHILFMGDFNLTLDREEYQRNQDRIMKDLADAQYENDIPKRIELFRKIAKFDEFKRVLEFSKTINVTEQFGEGVFGRGIEFYPTHFMKAERRKECQVLGSDKDIPAVDIKSQCMAEGVVHGWRNRIIYKPNGNMRCIEYNRVDFGNMNKSRCAAIFGVFEYAQGILSQSEILVPYAKIEDINKANEKRNDKELVNKFAATIATTKPGLILNKKRTMELFNEAVSKISSKQLREDIVKINATTDLQDRARLIDTFLVDYNKRGNLISTQAISDEEQDLKFKQGQVAAYDMLIGDTRLDDEQRRLLFVKRKELLDAIEAEKKPKASPLALAYHFPLTSANTQALTVPSSALSLQKAQLNAPDNDVTDIDIS